MVKRDDDAIETSLGRARDTDGSSAQPGSDADEDAATNLTGFYYRPEMGSIIATNDSARGDDS